LKTEKEELLERIDNAYKHDATKFGLFYRLLTELPPEIGKLTNLIELDLSVNKLAKYSFSLPVIPNLFRNLMHKMLSGLTPFYIKIQILCRFPEILKQSLSWT